MKFNKWTLELAVIAAIGVLAIAANANTQAPNGKEVAGLTGTELVVAEAQMDASQISSLGDIACYEATLAQVDVTEITANNTEANTATGTFQAASAPPITDQLALKILGNV